MGFLEGSKSRLNLFLKSCISGFPKCVVNSHRLGEFMVGSIYLARPGLCEEYAGNRLWSMGHDMGWAPLTTVSHVLGMFVCLIMSGFQVLRRLVSRRRVLLLY